MRLFSAVALLSSMILAGCSDAADEASRVPVFPASGKIMMNGRPVAGASVTFSPMGEEQETAYATTDSSGEFKLTTYDADDGAAAGKYKVVILKATAPKSDESSDEGHSADPNAPIAEAHAATASSSSESLDTGVVPEKFGTVNDTPLEREVTSNGDNRFEIDLLK